MFAMRLLFLSTDLSILSIFLVFNPGILYDLYAVVEEEL